MFWWIIVYFSINLIIAVFCTINTAKEGYYTNWSSGKTYWVIATLIFVALLIFGLPIIIVGGIILLFEG